MGVCKVAVTRDWYGRSKSVRFNFVELLILFDFVSF